MLFHFIRMRLWIGFIILQIAVGIPSFASSSMSLENILKVGLKEYLPYADAVAEGVQQGMLECQYQFRWERWNCSESEFTLYNIMDNQKVTREYSFARAISSGAVSHIITKYCSTGFFNNCACDYTKNGQKGGYNWVWQGCSDNVVFGDRVSRHFIDGLETGKDARAAINIHNNDAGRKAVKRTMRTLCKCHGVSGSCSTKTCWRQLSAFRAAGDYLKRQYTRAIQIDFQNVALPNPRGRKRERFIRAHRRSAFRKSHLLYLEQSPDFCVKNSSHWTLGRQCSRPADKLRATRPERKSCHQLCTSCGLGVVKSQVQVMEKCQCKFFWCCSVQCSLCKETREMFACAKP